MGGARNKGWAPVALIASEPGCLACMPLSGLRHHGHLGRSLQGASPKAGHLEGHLSGQLLVYLAGSAARQGKKLPGLERQVSGWKGFLGRGGSNQR